MPMLLQLLFLLFTPGFASTLDCTLSPSGVPVQWKNKPVDKCCTDPSGIQDEMSLFKPKNSSAVGTCTTKDKPAASTDPRVFGPTLWKAFHLIATNFPSPPTKAAHQACVAFIMALPYLVPCRHCGWDLGVFIKFNIDHENDTVVDPKCFGFSHKTQDFTEPCESPERACMSTYRMTSFFALTKPCRKPYTTEEALDQYLAAPDGTCFHNTVWGSKQLCTGPYCSTNRPCTGTGHFFGLARASTCSASHSCFDLGPAGLRPSATRPRPNQRLGRQTKKGGRQSARPTRARQRKALPCT
eukprot:scaffold4073_cov61-Phaeocystis_antarctica.AAC.4